MAPEITRRLFLAGGAGWAASGPRPLLAQAARILVFAAASLKSALDELAAPLAQASGGAVRVSYAASSALARQIESGAPADLFISADTEWMDYLAARRLIVSASRRDLLGNRLVLIARKDDPIAFAPVPGADWAQALRGGRLALAETSAVPAGRYARAALSSLGVWDLIGPRAAQAENVRAALTLVERGEAPLGIVYASDAVAEPGVRVVATLAPGLHPPIAYPAAPVAGRETPAVRRALAFLSGPEALAHFRRWGFLPPEA